MSTTSPRPGSPDRVAVALLFLTNGALISNLLPR
jgi:hypothetical protein